MTRSTLSLAAALLAAAVALTGCSSGTGTSESEAATTTAPSPTAAETAPASEPASGAASPATSTALIGMVGTAEDPDAYEIAITDESGAPITSLPAGDYTLTFADRSASHNFRLSGPGGVDVATDVGGVDESTIELTLEPGTYVFVCDPHPASMSGELEVTG